MRPFVLALFLSVAVLFPKTGKAQVYQFRTAPPEVTAAAADWQVNSEPVMVGGLVYYPTRGFRFFDGQVMAQIGIFERVPVYADTTLEPFSVLYVPVSRDRMREYERRRVRELAGTTGSRVPSFPVESASVQALRDRPVGSVGSIESSLRMTALGMGATPQPAPELSAAGTAGTFEPRAASPAASPAGRVERRRVRCSNRRNVRAGPTASGSSSMAPAGTRTARRRRSRPIASSRSACIAGSRSTATR